MSVLRTEHITKDYPGCRALDDVTVSFDSKKVHAFLGKNGSGKSTLVKIFAGAIKPTQGKFFLDDEISGTWSINDDKNEKNSQGGRSMCVCPPGGRRMRQPGKRRD